MTACHKANVDQSGDQRPSIASIMRHHRDAYRGRVAILSSATQEGLAVALTTWFGPPATP